MCSHVLSFIGGAAITCIGLNVYKNLRGRRARINVNIFTEREQSEELEEHSPASEERDAAIKSGQILDSNATLNKSNAKNKSNTVDDSI